MRLFGIDIDAEIDPIIASISQPQSSPHIYSLPISERIVWIFGFGQHRQGKELIFPDHAATRGGHTAADRSIVVFPCTTEAATLAVHSVVIEKRERKKAAN